MPDPKLVVGYVPDLVEILDPESVVMEVLDSKLVVVPNSKLMVPTDINLETLSILLNMEKMVITVTKMDPGRSNINFWNAAVTTMFNSCESIITSGKAALQTKIKHDIRSETTA